MLTAITIKNAVPRSPIARLWYGIMGDKIITDLSSAGGVVLRHITYINRTGKINCTKLASDIGEAREVLCEQNTVLPEGVTRYDDSGYKALLSVNLGMNIIKKLNSCCPGLPVCLYDPTGKYSGALEELAKYNDSLTAVTDNPDAYDEVCDGILDELGAVVTVTSDRQCVRRCRLVIAPDIIYEPLPLSGKAVVLTCSAPMVSLCGLCYYDYSFRMPNTFAEIKPEELSAVYFSGALCLRARQYELGSIVPASCSNNTHSQTSESLADWLRNTS